MVLTRFSSDAQSTSGSRAASILSTFLATGSRSQYFEVHTRARVASGGRNCLGLEWLEPRHLLTGNSSPIAAVQPYNGQQLSQSPQELDITFNGLIVPAYIGNFDVQLEELNRDGSKTPIWTLDDAPPEQTGAAPTELIIPLQKLIPSDYSYDNLTLPAGEYEIDLVGGTGISYAASGANGPGPQLWDPDQDHSIGTFTVMGQGASISSATDLGTIGSSVRTEWGSLNPDDPQTAVRPLSVHTARRALLAGGAPGLSQQHRQPALAWIIAPGFSRQCAGDSQLGPGTAKQS